MEEGSFSINSNKYYYQILNGQLLVDTSKDFSTKCFIDLHGYKCCGVAMSNPKKLLSQADRQYMWIITSDKIILVSLKCNDLHLSKASTTIILESTFSGLGKFDKLQEYDTAFGKSTLILLQFTLSSFTKSESIIISLDYSFLYRLLLDNSSTTVPIIALNTLDYIKINSSSAMTIQASSKYSYLNYNIILHTLTMNKYEALRMPLQPYIIMIPTKGKNEYNRIDVAHPSLQVLRYLFEMKVKAFQFPDTLFNFTTIIASITSDTSSLVTSTSTYNIQMPLWEACLHYHLLTTHRIQLYTQYLQNHAIMSGSDSSSSSSNSNSSQLELIYRDIVLEACLMTDKGADIIIQYILSKHYHSLTSTASTTMVNVISASYILEDISRIYQWCKDYINYHNQEIKEFLQNTPSLYFLSKISSSQLSVDTLQYDDTMNTLDVETLYQLNQYRIVNKGLIKIMEAFRIRKMETFESTVQYTGTDVLNMSAENNTTVNNMMIVIDSVNTITPDVKNFALQEHENFLSSISCTIIQLEVQSNILDTCHMLLEYSPFTMKPLLPSPQCTPYLPLSTLLSEQTINQSDKGYQYFIPTELHMKDTLHDYFIHQLLALLQSSSLLNQVNNNKDAILQEITQIYDTMFPIKEFAMTGEYTDNQNDYTQICANIMYLPIFLASLHTQINNKSSHSFSQSPMITSTKLLQISPFPLSYLSVSYNNQCSVSNTSLFIDDSIVILSKQILFYFLLQMTYSNLLTTLLPPTYNTSSITINATTLSMDQKLWLHNELNSIVTIFGQNLQLSKDSIQLIYAIWCIDNDLGVLDAVTILCTLPLSTYNLINRTNNSGNTDNLNEKDPLVLHKLIINKLLSLGHDNGYMATKHFISYCLTHNAQLKNILLTNATTTTTSIDASHNSNECYLLLATMASSLQGDEFVLSWLKTKRMIENSDLLPIEKTALYKLCLHTICKWSILFGHLSTFLSMVMTSEEVLMIGDILQSLCITDKHSSSDTNYSIIKITIAWMIQKELYIHAKTLYTHYQKEKMTRHHHHQQQHSTTTTNNNNAISYDLDLMMEKIIHARKHLIFLN